MKTFGDVLKEKRRELRITQRDLANRIGVDFSYISKIETGALDPPSEALIVKIAQVLEVDADEMVLLAKKVPTPFKESILADQTANMFFRQFPNLTVEQKRKIEDIIKGD